MGGGVTVPCIYLYYGILGYTIQYGIWGVLRLNVMINIIINNKYIPKVKYECLLVLFIVVIIIVIIIIIIIIWHISHFWLWLLFFLVPNSLFLLPNRTGEQSSS